MPLQIAYYLTLQLINWNVIKIFQVFQVTVNVSGVSECPYKMKDMKLINLICIMQIICEDYAFSLHYAFKNFISNT